MPVYNAESYVALAIESILKQTYSDFEFVIVEDGSSDSSLSIIKSYSDKRIQLYPHKTNKGVAYSRNQGIELCKGEYLALMDADDIAPLDRLEKSLRFLEENPQVDAVGGKVIVIDGKGNYIHTNWQQYENPRYIKAYMILNNTVANGSILFRKSVVKENSIQYLDGMLGMEDYRFWCEFLHYGTIANMNETLQYYRVVESGLSEQAKRKKRKEREQVMDEIHRYNFDWYGFEFEEKEKELLLGVFQEEGKVKNEEEVERLYKGLKKMSQQAYELKLEHAEEIKTMCRKRFGEKLGKAMFLWE